jgi:hypothetical protein
MHSVGREKLSGETIRSWRRSIKGLWINLDQPAVGQAVSLLRRYLGSQARPLPRSQLIRMLCEVAENSRLGVDDKAIFRWEASHNGVSRTYRRLLGQVCAREMAKWNVGLQHEFIQHLRSLTGQSTATTSASDLLLTLRYPAAPQIAAKDRLWGDSIDDPPLEDLAMLNLQYSKLVQAGACGDLLPAVRDHLAYLGMRLSGSHTDAVRRRLQVMAGQAAVLAGRLSHLDGNRSHGRSYYSMAIRLGKEAGEHHVQAMALLFAAATFSSVPSLGAVKGNTRIVLALQEEADSLLSPTASHMFQAWAAASRATVFAQLGHSSDTVKHMDDAALAAEMAHADDVVIDIVMPDPEALCLASFGPSNFAGQCALEFGQPAKAISAYEVGLHETVGRAKGNRLSGLAAAYAMEGEIEGAAWLLGQALDLAVRDEQPSQIERAEGVYMTRLARWREKPAVQQLEEQLLHSIREVQL